MNFLSHSPFKGTHFYPHTNLCSEHFRHARVHLGMHLHIHTHIHIQDDSWSLSFSLTMPIPQAPTNTKGMAKESVRLYYGGCISV